VSEPITVAAFAGSLRHKSHNRGLLRAAAEIAPEHVKINIVDLTPLPFYNADCDGPKAPDSVLDFHHQLAAADALLIACPEYNYSVTGVLKNALDWASRRLDPNQPPPMQGKPAAIMGAGGRFGTVRAQSHLRYILLHNDLKVLNKPEIMVVRSGDCFDGEGNLHDATVRGQVEELINALYKWTIQLRK
jgi:chromate reductase, NAD(P)H dehydrogenase (quinone)